MKDIDKYCQPRDSSVKREVVGYSLEAHDVGSKVSDAGDGEPLKKVTMIMLAVLPRQSKSY